MGGVISPVQEMNVVRGNEADAEVLRDLRQHAVTNLLLLNSVVVQLDKEILCAENVAILGGEFRRLVDLVGLNRRVHLAGQAATQSDQSGRVRSEQFLVDPGTIVKTVEVRGGK